jgi:hypothetical protein
VVAGNVMAFGGDSGGEVSGPSVGPAWLLVGVCAAAADRLLIGPAGHAAGFSWSVAAVASTTMESSGFDSGDDICEASWERKGVQSPRPSDVCCRRGGWCVSPEAEKKKVVRSPGP